MNSSKASNDTLVRIRGLRFNRGSRVIFDGVDIDIPRGGVTAIMGPSGTGKTTLLNLLAGTLLPSGGEIGVGETRVDRLSETGRRRFRVEQVGQVFQAFELLDYLTVEENVLLPALRERIEDLDSLERERLHRRGAFEGHAQPLRGDGLPVLATGSNATPLGRLRAA